MLSGMSENPGKSTSEPTTTPLPNADDERSTLPEESLRVPDRVAGSGGLDRLVDSARGYARQATAQNTNAAYKADWTHFSRWCRMRGTDPLPPRLN